MLPVELLEIVYREIWCLRMRRHILPRVRIDDERTAIARSIVRMIAANIGILPSKNCWNDKPPYNDVLLNYIAYFTHNPPVREPWRKKKFGGLLYLCTDDEKKKKLYDILMGCKEKYIDIMKEWLILLNSFHPDIHWDTYILEGWWDIDMETHMDYTEKHAECRYYRKSFETVSGKSDANTQNLGLPEFVRDSS